MENLTANEGKTNAIISYLTLIGTIVAYALNTTTKNSFASFHIRQNIGLNILFFLNKYIIYDYFGWLAGGIIGFVLFILWVIGLIGAINGEEKRIPVFGDQFQAWFKNI